MRIQSIVLLSSLSVCSSFLLPQLITPQHSSHPNLYRCLSYCQTKRSDRGRICTAGANIGSSSSFTIMNHNSDTSRPPDDDGSDCDEYGNMLKSIENQTLLSVKTCLDIYRIMTNKSGKEIEKRINKVVFIDASWWHKGDLNGRKMFETGPRIKDSIYMDIDDISMQYDIFPNINPKKLPHMLPPAHLFALFMDEYNISNHDHIIIYGRKSVLFTPRTWFLFQSFGHNPSKVHLMQGSLEEWIDLGGDTETNPVIVPRAKDLLASKTTTSTTSINKKHDREEYFCRPTSKYIPREYPSNVLNMDQVLNYVIGKDTSKYVIIDSRGSSFVKGNIPNSVHIPYSTLMEPDNTLKLKDKDELSNTFMEAGVDPLTDKIIICSCGSGVSACTVFLALEQCGRNIDDKKSFMYDGSWSEWGAEHDTPKVIKK